MLFHSVTTPAIIIMMKHINKIQNYLQLLRFQRQSQHASNLYVKTGSEAASKRLENFPSILHTQDHEATALPETPHTSNMDTTAKGN